VPNNGRIIRNLAMGANYLMSHILHFYHLVALDYVDVNGTGLIPKGFLCPNYDRRYYARGIDPVLQSGGLGIPAYTVNDAPVPSGLIPPSAFGDLTPYFAGQYVRALKIRRMAQQLGAMFTGKMPLASMYTPGAVSTKAYDPTPGGSDAAVVDKFHELLYAGPGNSATAPGIHPLNGTPNTMANPHPESIMGFIGKPKDFWVWAATPGPNFPAYDPHYLPIWAQAGIPLATGAGWREFTGTYLFDAVAAAHVFPEYFWLGTSYGRFLAWGIFEQADIMGFGDNRLLTRGRTHVRYNPNGSGFAYGFNPHPADHLKVKEYTKHSWYNDSPLTKGRHPWVGKTRPNPNKAGAYTYAKSPRYGNNESTLAWEVADHPNGDWIPYEVGPLARGMANARGLATPGGPAITAEVLAVDAGNAYAYYPGILQDVDTVLGGFLPIAGGKIGVLPGWAGNLPATGTTNLTTHLTTALGLGIFYLPPNAVPQGALTNAYKADYMGDGALDRIAARALETYFVGMQMLSWFNGLLALPNNWYLGVNPNDPVIKDPTDATYIGDISPRHSNVTRLFNWGGKDDQIAPRKSKGAGLTEAPRGALGHWIKIGKPKSHPSYKSYRGKVERYQIITPTAWNISGKDHNDVRGPLEESIFGTPVVDETEPIEILRVIHSYDLCCACTVHVTNAKKEKKFKGEIEPTF
jgi:Ni,Fe-hydrogenase I large subunit